MGGKPGTDGSVRGAVVGLSGSISEVIEEGGAVLVVGVDEIGGEPSGKLEVCDCGFEEEGVIILELRFGAIGLCPYVFSSVFSITVKDWAGICGSGTD
jgi:hypothetical protein